MHFPPLAPRPLEVVSNSLFTFTHHRDGLVVALKDIRTAFCSVEKSMVDFLTHYFGSNEAILVIFSSIRWKGRKTHSATHFERNTLQHILCILQKRRPAKCVTGSNSKCVVQFSFFSITLSHVQDPSM